MTVLLENVIARVESSDRPYAIRFEPGLWKNTPSWVGGTTPAIAHANGCTGDTALAIACTSYGLFQLLGATLYGDLSFPNPISFFHYDAEQQVTQFRALVKRWGFDWQNFDFSDMGLIQKFSARYNGPGNVADYSSKIVGTYMQLQQGG